MILLSFECIFQIIFALAYVSYLRAKFSNPGYLPSNLQPPPQGFLSEKVEKYCNRCRNQNPPWKPPRAHHCSICNKCIFRMDHHCDFIDNCVGIKNQKFFIQFLLFTMIYSFLVAILFFICFVVSVFIIDSVLKLVNWNNLFLLLIFALSIYFTIYSYEFLVEQYDGIIQNQTTVESYRSALGLPGTFKQNISQIFGKNILSWFVPTKAKINCNYLEHLYSLADILAAYKTKQSRNQTIEIPQFFKDKFQYYFSHQEELQIDDYIQMDFFEEKHAENQIYLKYKIN